MSVRNICILVLFLCLSATMVFSQSDRPVEIIDTLIVESFDAETTDWTVKSSESAIDRVLNETVLLESRVVDAWPNQLFGYEPIETRRAFGIRAGFRRRGNNYIEIVPPGGSLGLQGFVKEIELWVWNARRNYSVTIQLQDFGGTYHTIEMGDINHLGWARLSARIPNYVLQTSRLHEKVDGLRLFKIIVWTDPLERVDDFQIYFDELRVLSDIYQPRIDGEELIDPDFIQQVWGDA